MQKFIDLIVLLGAIIFLNACGSSNPHSTGSTSSGTSGSSGGSGSGSGTSNAVPGFGEGIGSSGQTSPAKFLYANPLPGGGPFAAMIQSNGMLTAAQSASVNNNDPMTIAIDPSGSFLFQTALPNGALDGNAVPGGK